VNYGAGATVTVTDACGVTDTVEIRNTGGVWDNTFVGCSAGSAYSETGYCIREVGFKKHLFSWHLTAGYKCSGLGWPGSPREYYCNSSIGGEYDCTDNMWPNRVWWRYDVSTAEVLCAGTAAPGVLEIIIRYAGYYAWKCP
jgi:hypothetical protein